MPAVSAYFPDQPGAAAPADAALLARIAAGDQVAFAALYDRHSTPLYRRAYRLLGQREAAEDAVQTAFLNVWRRAGTFDPARGDAGAWLMVSVSHAAIDQLRGRAGRARGDAPLDGLVTRAASDDPHAVVVARERRGLVRVGVAALPAAQREAVTLTYFAEMDGTALATHEGVPLGTVKGRLRLARAKLRDTFAALGLD